MYSPGVGFSVDDSLVSALRGSATKALLYTIMSLIRFNKFMSVGMYQIILVLSKGLQEIRFCTYIYTSIQWISNLYPMEPLSPQDNSGALGRVVAATRLHDNSQRTSKLSLARLLQHVHTTAPEEPPRFLQKTDP